MKILFAIQGTGNGHISRAREIIPYLKEYGEVDLLVSGTQLDVQLPYPIKYRLHGLSFTFGKKGGIDFWDSFKKLNTFRLLRDIFSLPVNEYDLVINDFEPVTAWACKLRKKTCIGLSHQASFLSALTPRPSKKNLFAESVFRYYAPCSKAFAFHFESYDHFIYPPVIRSEVRRLEPTDRRHVTVYLPAYDDKLLVKHFEPVDSVRWEVFSKHAREAYTHKHIHVMPINNEAYTQSLAHCTGLITGGGFEAPAEAIFLNKKVMVIPMIGQYEQHCNALGAKKAGCTVLKEINTNFTGEVKRWLEYARPVHIPYPDQTQVIIKKLVQENYAAN